MGAEGPLQILVSNAHHRLWVIKLSAVRTSLNVCWNIFNPFQDCFLSDGRSVQRPISNLQIIICLYEATHLAHSIELITNRRWWFCFSLSQTEPILFSHTRGGFWIYTHNVFPHRGQNAIQSKREISGNQNDPTVVSIKTEHLVYHCPTPLRDPLSVFELFRGTHIVKLDGILKHVFVQFEDQSMNDELQSWPSDGWLLSLEWVRRRLFGRSANKSLD